MTKFSIRKIGVIGRTSRLFNRYLHILAVLVKYGFGDIVERLKIYRYVEAGFQAISGKKPVPVEILTRAERIRMTIEGLGPTFTKLGQILSTRPDLVPIDLVDELSKLQDQVPSRPFGEIRAIIETELDSKVKDVFDYIDEIPLASASIGQVHRARFLTGEDVAVKVQRNGIRKIVEVDLEIMLHLAMFMENHIEEMELHRPVRIVEEFARVLGREMDYTIEASNMERFGTRFLNDSLVYIPRVFHRSTTERVLTMEFISGVKISDLQHIDAAGLDKKTITGNGADFFMKQLFDFGFFHADPHPGNIFILPGNIICLLDFGMVGTVDRNTREDFVDLIEGVVRRDESKISRVLLRITEFDEDPDIRLLEKEVSEFIGMHLYKPLKEIEMGAMFHSLFELAARHRLRIPPDIFLMMKAFGTIEGVARNLDPEFDMTAHAAPFVERIKIARYYPGRLADDLVKILAEFLKFMERFPKDSLDIFRMIRKRKLLINIEHQGLESIIATHDRISNKISFSIIAAALIIGSALIVLAQIPPLFYGISVVGIILFFAAAVMGIWLLVAILRKGGL